LGAPHHKLVDISQKHGNHVFQILNAPTTQPEKWSFQNSGHSLHLTTQLDETFNNNSQENPGQKLENLFLFDFCNNNLVYEDGFLVLFFFSSIK
jgi:hypothetical protein